MVVPVGQLEWDREGAEKVQKREAENLCLGVDVSWDGMFMSYGSGREFALPDQ